MPKFTQPKRYGKTPFTINGWSNDGLDMYNTVYKVVQQDRQDSGKLFCRLFKEAMEEQLVPQHSTTRKRKRRMLQQVQAYNDLKGVEPCEEEEDYVNFKAFPV